MEELIAGWILNNFNIEVQAAEAIGFFIYDSIKIMLLLFFMIAVIGFLRSYLSPKRVRKWMKSGHIMASVFGAITPFCSCSSIPLFLGFVRAGVPLGVTFSFLITSPLVNEYLVVLMLGFFGWKITVAYVLSGILIGVVAGKILGMMGLEKHLIRDVAGSNIKTDKFESISQRIKSGIDEAWSIIKKLWLWILVGVGFGALIHGYVPQETIHDIISKTGIFTVPLAALLGVPIYASCAAIVPVAVVLFEKGVQLGSALAFMMASSALSLPEAMILKRAMKLKLIIAFFGIVTLGIIVTGYLFNLFQIWLG